MEISFYISKLCPAVRLSGSLNQMSRTRVRDYMKRISSLRMDYRVNIDLCKYANVLDTANVLLCLWQHQVIPGHG